MKAAIPLLRTIRSVLTGGNFRAVCHKLCHRCVTRSVAAVCHICLSQALPVAGSHTCLSDLPVVAAPVSPLSVRSVCRICLSDLCVAGGRTSLQVQHPQTCRVGKNNHRFLDFHLISGARYDLPRPAPDVAQVPGLALLQPRVGLVLPKGGVFQAGCSVVYGWVGCKACLNTRPLVFFDGETKGGRFNNGGLSVSNQQVGSFQ